jgi:hypothetical protein
MKQWDEVVTPVVFKAAKAPAPELEPAFLREVEELARTARSTPPRSLLGLHVATFWQRFTWAVPESAGVARLRAADGLGAWLDAALALEAVQQTAPDREATIKALRARFLS